MAAVIPVWDLEALCQECTWPVVRILPLELHQPGWIEEWIEALWMWSRPSTLECMEWMQHLFL